MFSFLWYSFLKNVYSFHQIYSCKSKCEANEFYNLCLYKRYDWRVFSAGLQSFHTAKLQLDWTDQNKQKYSLFLKTSWGGPQPDAFNLLTLQNDFTDPCLPLSMDRLTYKDLFGSDSTVKTVKDRQGVCLSKWGCWTWSCSHCPSSTQTWTP